jgi:hypothetical protein
MPQNNTKYHSEKKGRSTEVARD